MGAGSAVSMGAGSAVSILLCEMKAASWLINRTSFALEGHCESNGTDAGNRVPIDGGHTDRDV